jgi:dynein heavy chain, axonemal
LREKEEKMKEGLEIFCIEPQFYSELSQVERETDLLMEMWKVKEEWDTEWDSWKDIRFTEINTKLMEDRAGEILDQLRGFDRDVRIWGIYEFIKNKIEGFRNELKPINDLRSEALRDRHWHELRSLLADDFDQTSADFTLEKLTSLNLERYEK